jgi:hypothetical protein
MLSITGQKNNNFVVHFNDYKADISAIINTQSNQPMQSQNAL